MGTRADSFYSSPAWTSLRRQVLARDGDRCTVAQLLGGACKGSLHVNHIRPRRERPDLALDPDNCGTACARHHRVWETVRRYIVRSRDRAIDADLDRAARLERAIEEAENLAGGWDGDSVGLHDRLDEIERRHRIVLRYLERDRIVAMRPLAAVA